MYKKFIYSEWVNFALHKYELCMSKWFYIHDSKKLSKKSKYLQIAYKVLKLSHRVKNKKTNKALLRRFEHTTHFARLLPEKWFKDLGNFLPVPRV